MQTAKTAIVAYQLLQTEEEREKEKIESYIIYDHGAWQSF